MVSGKICRNLIITEARLAEKKDPRGREVFGLKNTCTYFNGSLHIPTCTGPVRRKATPLHSGPPPANSAATPHCNECCSGVLSQAAGDNNYMLNNKLLLQT